MTMRAGEGLGLSATEATLRPVVSQNVTVTAPWSVVKCRFRIPLMPDAPCVRTLWVVFERLKRWTCDQKVVASTPGRAVTKWLVRIWVGDPLNHLGI